MVPSMSAKKRDPRLTRLAWATAELWKALLPAPSENFAAERSGLSISTVRRILDGGGGYDSIATFVQFLERDVKAHQSNETGKRIDELRAQIQALQEGPPLQSPRTTALPTKTELSCQVDLLRRSQRDGVLGVPRERIWRARQSVWLSGSTLTVASSGEWRGFTETSAIVRVLFPDPEDENSVASCAALDDRTPHDERETILRSLAYFSTQSTNSGPVEVRILAYCPSFSVFAVDADSNDANTGYISIELTGFAYQPAATPSLVLRAAQQEHREMYRYFAGQWNKMWTSARPWKAG